MAGCEARVGPCHDEMSPLATHDVNAFGNVGGGIVRGGVRRDAVVQRAGHGRAIKGEHPRGDGWPVKPLGGSRRWHRSARCGRTSCAVGSSVTWRRDVCAPAVATKKNNAYARAKTATRVSSYAPCRGHEALTRSLRKQKTDKLSPPHHNMSLRT